MKFLIDLISEQLSGAFEKAGFDAAYGRATLSLHYQFFPEMPLHP